MSESDDNQNWLILKNVDNLPPAYGGDLVFPGSTKIRADCGCECWIAPLARKTLNDPSTEMMTICTNHLARSPELQQGIRENGLRAVVGQRLEMSEVLSKELVDDLFARLRVREE